MGNRAIVKPVDSNIGVYLHWNGGRDSVEAFLEYCRIRGFRDFGGEHADGFGIARFLQVVSNFFGGSLDIGIQEGVVMDTSCAKWIDNGIYEIDGWNIVGRCPGDIAEQSCHNIQTMLELIDSAQPKNEQLGLGFLRGKEIEESELKPGDIIWVYSDHINDEPKCQKHKITGIEDDDPYFKGKPFYTEEKEFGSGRIKRYLSGRPFRLETTPKIQIS